VGLGDLDVLALQLKALGEHLDLDRDRGAPTRTMREKNDRMSPTLTGCLKMNSFTATVTMRPLTRRAGKTAPARSTWAMTQPPKMSPLALQSAGMGMTLSTSSWSVGKATVWGRWVLDMGTIGG
jgi:hypothetical protein